MAKVPGRDGPFCIQRYEASFSGTVGNADQGTAFPDGSTTGTLSSAAGSRAAFGMSWYQAVAACQGAGLHLCTTTEWNDACAGPGARAYPTPDGRYRDGVCGVRLSTTRPADTGAWPDCHTPEGVYDLLGNVWEWADPGVREADGTPLADKHGAAHYTYEPAGCAFAGIGSDAPSFIGTVGFRCCAPLQAG
jgi:formylglycine-generating enzyme required for sulfatase activity